MKDIFWTMFLVSAVIFAFAYLVEYLEKKHERECNEYAINMYREELEELRKSVKKINYNK